MEQFKFVSLVAMIALVLAMSTEAKSKSLIPPDDFCGEKTFQGWVKEIKGGNKKSFKKLLSVIGELDGCLAEDWASAMTNARKEAPEIFYLGLQSEDRSLQEFVLHTIVHEWWGLDGDNPELFNTLDQLIQKHTTDKKRSAFLEWCRSYMQDLAKKGFED